jgi:hypothetical protein
MKMMRLMMIVSMMSLGCDSKHDVWPISIFI